MSKRRKRWNKICSEMTKPEVVEYRPVDKRSREEMIVDIVTQECGRYSLSTLDDLASNIIVKVWEEHLFGEDFDRIRAYIRGCIRIELKKWQRETPISQLDKDDYEPGRLLDIIGQCTTPNQHTRVMALEAYFLTLALPNDQCQALHILAGGGSPIDVCREMELEPWEAILLIKEARQNLYRVDPRWDEAA